MDFRLVIAQDGYTLEQSYDGGWAPLAALARGDAALLPPARPVDEARLEAAIERAEDWLMPYAPRLRDATLHVTDGTGRLRSGLTDVLGTSASSFVVDEVEALFLRLVDLATGRVPSPALAGRQAFVADVLLLRELAHHGRLRGLTLA